MYSVFLWLLEQHGMTVADFSKATGISQSTLSNWKHRDNLISGKNAQIIANFFGVSVDFLMTGKEIERESESGNKYYFSDTTAATAQLLFENKDLRVLFDAARDSKPEDLQMAADLLKRLKETNRDG